jgi:hypothetical protein
MAGSNGIGAQLIHMAAADFIPYRHFWYAAPWSRGSSSVAASSEVGRLHRWLTSWPWRRGRGFIRRLCAGLDPLDGAGELRLGAFERVLARTGGEFPYAYVTPICEADARPVLAMVRRLGCPYLVHLWDLTHREAMISPELMPSLCALLRGADAVYCLTAEIARAVAIPGVRVDGLLSFGRPHPTHGARPPEDGGPLRIAMMGGTTDYSAGMRVLVDAWARLSSRVPCELVYLGWSTLRPQLPMDGSMRIESHGFVDDEARDRLLASCHLAFISGPSEDPDHEVLSRYSIPSRIGDYLHHGLPVIANFHPRSAAIGFFREVTDQGLFVAREPEAVLAAVERLRRPGAWVEASRSAKDFARLRLDHRTLRERVLEHARPYFD